MKSNEGLMTRKIPSQAVKNALVPSKSEGSGMEIPFDSSNAIRKLKKSEWTEEKIYESTFGTSVYLKMIPSQAANEIYQAGVAEDKVPTPIIAKFTVGEIPMFSTYVDSEAPLYKINGDTKVTDISISWSNPENDFPMALTCVIKLDDGRTIQADKSKKSYKIGGIKRTDAFSFPQDDGTLVECPSVLEIAVLADGDYGMGLQGAKMLDDDSYEEIEKYYEAGNVVLYLEPEIELYASPDMYVGTDLEDKYLLPPEVNYADLDSIGTNQAVKFNLVIENPTFSTDNYTGRNSRKPTTKLVETIIFPGDESLLAPSGYTENGNPADCGLELPEGRVLKSIKPAVESGVLISVALEFRDGTKCIFPDPELKTFSATDKESEQLLKGVVDMDSFVLFNGDIKAEYEKIKEDRRMRNLNRDYNILIEDENLTRVVAWYSGERGEIMNVIVPDPDKPSKSIHIKIPMEA